MKSTVDEIRARFDASVERFSNLDTGHAATVEAPLFMELVAGAAAAVTPGATRMLDVGCGAGNYTLKLLEHRPLAEITLVDLSQPMLERAEQRIRQVHSGTIRPLQSDIRQLELGSQAFDIILAAAVLHHLRTDDEWRSVFAKFHAALAPGGSLWIFDLIESDVPGVRQLMSQRYADYLDSVGGADYRKHVFDYMQHEDTPRPLVYQLDLLRAVGFSQVEVLHVNSCFAAFGAVR